MIRSFVYLAVILGGPYAWAGPKNTGQTCTAHAECKRGLHCVASVCNDLNKQRNQCRLCAESGLCTVTLDEDGYPSAKRAEMRTVERQRGVKNAGFATLKTGNAE